MDKWIRNNTASKLLALGVSIILWAMVHMDSGTAVPPTTFYETRVIEGVQIQTYGFDDSEYALTGIDKDRVNLEVRGKRSNIMLFTDDYKVKLDLSGVKEPGTHTLPLTFSGPSGVELVSMEPSMVTVTVEERMTNPFNVTIGTKGEPAKGFRAGEPTTVEPGTVNVTLPESELATVAQVRGTVDLDGAKENVVEKKVKLTAYNNEGEAMEDAIIEPSSVAVEIPVEATFITAPLQVEYTGRLPDDLVISKVNPKVKEVKLYGSKEVLNGARPYVGVTVNLSNIKDSGTTVLTADLTPPEGFEKIEPSSVEIEVTAASHGERVVEGIPVTLKGVPSGMEATITDPRSQTMSMTLTGAPDQLNSLTSTDIGLVANVAGLKAGVHEIPLQVTLPNFINRVDQKRLVVKVELKEIDRPVTTKPTKPNEGKDNDKLDDPEEKPDSGSEDTPENSGEGNDQAGTESSSGEGKEEAPSGSGNESSNE